MRDEAGDFVGIAKVDIGGAEQHLHRAQVGGATARDVAAVGEAFDALQRRGERLAHAHFVDVVEAGDGRAELEELRAAPFDVVITDIEMPTFGGIALLSSIRRDAGLKHLPVLMVTAEARKDEILRCTQAGATAYLVKPFTRATLEEKLRSALPALTTSS